MTHGFYHVHHTSYFLLVVCTILNLRHFDVHCMMFTLNDSHYYYSAFYFNFRDRRINQTAAETCSSEGATILFPLTSLYFLSNVTQLSPSLFTLLFSEYKRTGSCARPPLRLQFLRTFETVVKFICVPLQVCGWTTHPHLLLRLPTHWTTRSRPLCQAPLWATAPRKWQHKVHSVPCHSLPEARW